MPSALGAIQRAPSIPTVLNLLKKLNYATGELRSKSWEEFAQPGAPELDFVFTVCDNAAGEVCPVWPGQPMTAHWGVPDPVSFEGTAAEKAAYHRGRFSHARKTHQHFLLSADSLD